jgi:hypothetical protein
MDRAIEDLIGKELIHAGRPARVNGINRSEAGEYYMIEECYENGDSVVVHLFAVPAMTINLIFSGNPPFDWHIPIPNLETFPRLEPGTKVRAIFNKILRDGVILKSFDDARGYWVSFAGTSVPIPVSKKRLFLSS